MFTIQDFFKIGMKRDIPLLLDMPEGIVLNVGAGNTRIDGATNLDYPEWNADGDDIPYGTETVAGIHAYHFLEHLEDPVYMLKEFQRVLKPGGIVNVVVPHPMGTMAFHDLDHKKFFVLDTWQVLFNNPYYDKHRIDWRLRVHVNFMMGIVERNMAIFTQLIKY